MISVPFHDHTTKKTIDLNPLLSALVWISTGLLVLLQGLEARVSGYTVFLALINSKESKPGQTVS